MFIGTCTVELHLPGNGSLKDKRRIVKSICNRVHNQFNVAIAEVDGHDAWQAAILGIACVSNDAAHAHQTLERVVAWIEGQRLDAHIVGYEIEIL